MARSHLHYCPVRRMVSPTIRAITGYSLLDFLSVSLCFWLLKIGSLFGPLIIPTLVQFSVATNGYRPLFGPSNLSWSESFDHHPSYVFSRSRERRFQRTILALNWIFTYRICHTWFALRVWRFTLRHPIPCCSRSAILRIS